MTSQITPLFAQYNAGMQNQLGLLGRLLEAAQLAQQESQFHRRLMQVDIPNTILRKRELEEYNIPQMLTNWRKLVDVDIPLRELSEEKFVRYEMPYLELLKRQQWFNEKVYRDTTEPYAVIGELAKALYGNIPGSEKYEPYTWGVIVANNPEMITTALNNEIQKYKVSEMIDNELRREYYKLPEWLQWAAPLVDKYPVGQIPFSALLSQYLWSRKNTPAPSTGGTKTPLESPSQPTSYPGQTIHFKPEYNPLSIFNNIGSWQWWKTWFTSGLLGNYFRSRQEYNQKVKEWESPSSQGSISGSQSPGTPPTTSVSPPADSLQRLQQPGLTPQPQLNMPYRLRPWQNFQYPGIF